MLAASIATMRIKLLAFSLLAMFLSCGQESNETVCPDVSCAAYTTQGEAQAAFDSDPSCLKALDGDEDGIACEELPNPGTGGCPTTSNCGCSNKNKAACGGDCCAWIVGTGCRCK